MTVETGSTSGTIVAATDWPVPWAAAICDWLGEIQVELPGGTYLEGCDLLGIMSSHDSKHEPLAAWWELTLESALRYAKRSQRSVFFSATSPYADRLRHACVRFGLPYLKLCRNDEMQSERGLHTATLRSQGNPLPNREDLMVARLEDRAIAILSHQLFGLHVRQGGRIARLVEARLAEPMMTPGSTIVAVKDRTIRAARTKRSQAALCLSDRGAVLWMHHQGKDAIRSDASIGTRVWGCDRRGIPSTWMPYGPASSNLLNSEEFLVHFTRGRQGTWPDQSQDHVFDEAIRLEWYALKAPLHTLQRILSTQRLIASSYLRRGSVRTVCFTAQSIRSMLEHREFQSHIGRWDWEPYGIAIRRSWLVDRGARPVRYLPGDVLSSLPIEEQAFGQPFPKDDRHRDWSIEREWRVKDDIRLCQIPADQAVVFVQSRSEAMILSSLSRWPIVFLSRDNTD